MDNSSTPCKFIDLIFRASGRWASWNPQYKIKVCISVTSLHIWLLVAGGRLPRSKEICPDVLAKKEKRWLCPYAHARAV